MAQVYALLVGIDEYRSPVRPLKGCVNDLVDARRYLAEAVGDRAVVRELYNAQATRAAVIDAFRCHLGRAGAGDTALFWFCGHGSQAPVPPQWWHLEPNGSMMQTILCVDSRRDDVPDLLDKELAVLIREAAARGPRVVVVLDCCHAAGANRTGPSAPTGRSTRPAPVRFVEPVAAPPDPARLLAELRAAVGARDLPDRFSAPDHVALAACQDHEVAHELPDRDGRVRGVFSLALLTALRRTGAVPTYRELVAAARGQVEAAVDRQLPVLFPPGSPIVDEPFLGGHLRPPTTTLTLRRYRDGWGVDAGMGHGLAAGPGAEDLRFAVPAQDPLRECRVRRVFADHCLVETLGWEPEPGRTYPVVLSHVARPATAVTVGGGGGDDAEAAGRVESAIRTAGPGGRPSPHLRLVPRDDPDRPADLVVATPAGGRLTIRGADGAWLADSDPGSGPGPAAGGDGPGPAAGGDGPDPESVIVGRLEHIARWRRVRSLANPVSRLAGLVRVEMIVPDPYEYVTPRHRRGLRPGGTGAVELEYEPTRRAMVPPSVFLRLDNASDRRLYCVLLNLTDRFRVHAGLFPGAFVAPGASAAAGEGELIELSLPPGRTVEPGARVRDWLMLIVSEGELNSDHFALPRLGEAPPDGRRVPPGPAGIVECLAGPAGYRDADRKPHVAHDWWTSTMSIVTRVPGGEGDHHGQRATG